MHLSKTLRDPLLYESKGSLHKLIYILKVIQIGSLFSQKDVIKIGNNH